MLNIVICGTPGTGKSSLVEKLKPKLTEFNFVNLSKFAIEHQCTSGYDEDLDTQIIDEDKLTDCLEPVLKEKKFNIIECIHSDTLPSDMVDWVYVCRTDITILYDRLKARDYNEKKITNNLQAEIFQTILDEAYECHGNSIVTELVSNNDDDLGNNLKIVFDKLQSLLIDFPVDDKIGQV